MDANDRMILMAVQDGAGKAGELIDALGIPKSTVYDRIRRMTQKDGSLIKRKGRLEVTPRARALLDDEGPAADLDLDGMSRKLPELDQLPTPHHRAFVELMLGAIEGREAAKTSGHHPAGIVVGPALTGKTGSLRFLCALHGLAEETHLLQMGTETNLSVGVRRSGRGEILTRRAVLSAPLAGLDELHLAPPEVFRLVKALYLRGEIRVPLENEVLEVRCTPIVAMNPIREGSVEDRTGLSGAEIRRAVVLDTTGLALPEKHRTGGEKILNAIRHRKALKKRKLEPTDGHAPDIYRIARACLLPQAEETFDAPMLVTISTGLTAFLPPRNAVVQTLYDYLSCGETIGSTRAGWFEAFAPLAQEFLLGRPTRPKEREPKHSLSPLGAQVMEFLNRRKANPSGATVETRIAGMSGFAEEDVPELARILAGARSRGWTLERIREALR